MTSKLKIVLITSGQPSVNPRLVKEADALTDAGFDVTVIYQYWNEWGTEMDRKLLPQKKWKTIRVGGTPREEKITYWQSRLLYKAGQIFAKYIFNSSITDILTIGRCTTFLIAEAKLHKAHIYIAHNLAALPAAVKAAKKNKAKVGFDAEDFHRNETTDDIQQAAYQLKVRLEEKYLPTVDYITASSIEISNRYQQLFPMLNPVTILNVFDHQDSTKAINRNDQVLKLVWFSQTIGQNRGLSDILMLIPDFTNLELHLLGDHDPFIIAQLTKDLAHDFGNRIFFYPPIPSTDLIGFCSKFDIGLALEPGFSINNDLALSNKIFTYVQAGLAIIASDTTAQQQFINQYPDLGETYDRKNLATLRSILNRYIEDPDFLIGHQTKAAWYAVHTLNWQHEKQKFLSVIKRTLAID